MKSYTMKRKHAYLILYCEDNIAELNMVLKEAQGNIGACYRMQYEGEKTISFMFTPMDENGVEHNGIGFIYHIRNNKLNLRGNLGWTRYKVDRLFPGLVEGLEEDMYNLFEEDIIIHL